ncbi:MAG: hypothetical protein ACK41G_03875 [Candidatus Thermochlorobacter sp.]
MLLSREEDAVLDALHFVLSFEELQKETRLEKAQLQACLWKMIENGDVQALAWSEEKKEYLPIEQMLAPLESYHFLATKEGLFRHHSA